MIVDFPGVMTDFADVQFGGFFVHIVEATAMGALKRSTCGSCYQKHFTRVSRSL